MANAQSPTRTPLFLLGVGLIGGSLLTSLLESDTYNITVLCRKETQAEVLKKLGVSVLFGGLDDSDLITKATIDNDIIIHTATADDQPSVKAILKGLGAKPPTAPAPVYLHTSGTGLLKDGGESVATTDNIFSDKHPEQIDSLPDTAFHRDVDLLIKNSVDRGEVGNARVGIILPTVIYGRGTGPFKKISIDVPAIIKESIERKQVAVVGQGKATWGQIHIKNLVTAYLTIISELSRSPSPARPLYWFAEHGEFVWIDLFTAVRDALEKRGLVSHELKLGEPPARLRVLLLAFPILLAWWAIGSRRVSSRPLPTSFAICSRSGQSQIRTLDAAGSLAQCIVVDKGLIATVGSLAEVRREWGDLDKIGRTGRGKGGGIKIIYLKAGAAMLPGLIDAHAHVLQYGEGVGSADLVGAKGVQVDVHALWVSPAILTLMGPLPDVVPGGSIVRTADGVATGVFLDNAMALVLAVVPPWTDADRIRFLTATARKMLDTGLTSVHDASLSLADIAFLKKIDQEGRLPIRIYGMVSCEPLNRFCGDEVERYDGDRAVKLFTDGALGSWGAAMEEPYSDNPKERGIMISIEAVFAPLIAKVIGDRANRVILDAYESAVPRGVDPAVFDARPRIEHAQIMSLPDIERMGRLGVVASVQPTHGKLDMAYAEARIGSERIKGAYSWKSLIGNGSRIALGSDFPVEQVNPLNGIYSAVSRCWLDGNSPHGEGGWYPAERLSLDQALRGFTIDAAWASFQEGRVGSLEVGKEADFVIFERDFAAVEMREIPTVKLLSTVVGGRLFSGKLQ
ncbi:hypothetical protein RQP46_008665 [Phenoliferia psychrophenolica]